jgi:hypothetical protein
MNSAIVDDGMNPTVHLRCLCDVEMDTADDIKVCQTTIYHLNLDLAVEKIREMNHLQFPLDHIRQWERGQMTAVHSMTDMWGPGRNGGVKSKFFKDKKAWRTWLGYLREVVMDWDGFDAWDWGGFKDMRTIDIKKLEQKDFYRLSLNLLRFFIHTFMMCLGYMPSPLLHPLILARPCCPRHRKKFATGLP